MDTYIKSIFLFLTVVLMFSVENGIAQNPKTLLISNSDWPPYFFRGKTDSPKGLAREILEICIPAAGYDYKFKFHPINRMFNYLENGKIDISIMSYKAKRERFLFYTKEPLFTEGYRPIVLKKSKIQIHSLDDFEPLRLGHFNGVRYTNDFLAYVEKRKKEKRLIIFPSFSSGLKMLLSKKMDVFVEHKNAISYKAQTLGVRDKIKILNYDIKTANYFIVLSKKSKVIKTPQEFLERLDGCSRRLKENGTYLKILKKYGL